MISTFFRTVDRFGVIRFESHTLDPLDFDHTAIRQALICLSLLRNYKYKSYFEEKNLSSCKRKSWDCAWRSATRRQQRQRRRVKIDCTRYQPLIGREIKKRREWGYVRVIRRKDFARVCTKRVKVRVAVRSYDRRRCFHRLFLRRIEIDFITVLTNGNIQERGDLDMKLSGMDW